MRLVLTLTISSTHMLLYVLKEADFHMSNTFSLLPPIKMKQPLYLSAMSETPVAPYSVLSNSFQKI